MINRLIDWITSAVLAVWNGFLSFVAGLAVSIWDWLVDFITGCFQPLQAFRIELLGIFFDMWLLADYIFNLNAFLRVIVCAWATVALIWAVRWVKSFVPTMGGT
jgi:hypothetical protein